MFPPGGELLRIGLMISPTSSSSGVEMKTVGGLGERRDLGGEGVCFLRVEGVIEARLHEVAFSCLGGVWGTGDPDPSGVPPLITVVKPGVAGGLAGTEGVAALTLRQLLAVDAAEGGMTPVVGFEGKRPSMDAVIACGSLLETFKLRFLARTLAGKVDKGPAVAGSDGRRRP
jgi:hypothetical protein